MSLKFIKNKENFVCEHCNAEVIGNGFTNHCPKCLWSKHVDVYPGDRKAECGGLMEPVEFIKEKEGYIFVHKCVKCGYTKRNKMAPDDDFDVAVRIVKKS
jgi:rubrerythrin